MQKLVIRSQTGRGLSGQRGDRDCRPRERRLFGTIYKQGCLKRSPVCLVVCPAQRLAELTNNAGLVSPVIPRPAVVGWRRRVVIRRRRCVEDRRWRPIDDWRSDDDAAAKAPSAVPATMMPTSMPPPIPVPVGIRHRWSKNGKQASNQECGQCAQKAGGRMHGGQILQTWRCLPQECGNIVTDRI
jgi:hypothetical protein